MSERIHFAIGPVPSNVAKGWLANSRQLIDGVRAYWPQLHIQVDDLMLELCEVLLDVWQSHAERNDVFDWAKDTDHDQLLMLVSQWVEIGSLTDDELELIGCTWAPEWARPFSDALVAGALRALDAAGPEGWALASRLRTGTSVGD